MKKVVLLVAAVAMVSLASCKKKGVCTCTEDGVETVMSYEDMTAWEKKAMKSDCASEAKLVKYTVDGEEIDLDDEEGADCEWSKK